MLKKIALFIAILVFGFVGVGAVNAGFMMMGESLNAVSPKGGIVLGLLLVVGSLHMGLTTMIRHVPLLAVIEFVGGVSLAFGWRPDIDLGIFSLIVGAMLIMHGILVGRMLMNEKPVSA